MEFSLWIGIAPPVAEALKAGSETVLPFQIVVGEIKEIQMPVSEESHAEDGEPTRRHSTNYNLIGVQNIHLPQHPSDTPSMYLLPGQPYVSVKSRNTSTPSTAEKKEMGTRSIEPTGMEEDPSHQWTPLPFGGPKEVKNLKERHLSPLPEGPHNNGGDTTVVDNGTARVQGGAKVRWQVIYSEDKDARVSEITYLYRTSKDPAGRPESVSPVQDTSEKVVENRPLQRDATSMMVGYCTPQPDRKGLSEGKVGTDLDHPLSIQLEQEDKRLQEVEPTRNVSQHYPKEHFENHLDLPDEGRLPLKEEGSVQKSPQVILDRDNPNRIDLHVEHDELGRVHIRLSHQNGAVEGKIYVFDSASLDFMGKALYQIVTDLTQEGINVGDFSLLLKNRDGHPDRDRRKEQRFIRPPEAEIDPLNRNHLISIIV